MAGLTGAEAARRLAANGPNAIPEVRPDRVRMLAAKFWAPVPWLLELAVLLELVLGDYVQSLVFAVLLIFNAVLAFAQEGRAQQAVELLRQRLTVTARVRRDGAWTQIPARELVLGDLVHVRQGDIVPADLKLLDGAVELDQSALTGESRGVGAKAGAVGYSGSVVVRGEASGEVTAVGTATFFGRTAELVSTAHAPGNMERLIFGIVKALIGAALLIVAIVVADGLVRHLSLHEMVPFVLILVIASVPVALPATFTLATALGSKEMSQRRVLVTRLAAIEEAASMEVLCTDKTGTLTQNILTVEALLALPPRDGAMLLQAAAAASDAATQDPLDLAILALAKARNLAELGERTSFVPFDPATKRSEATVHVREGDIRVVKGAPRVVGQLAGADEASLGPEVERMAASGARVLGVAQGSVGGSLELLGLIALADPPRADAARLVEDLHHLGIRVVMLTGDSLATASAIAAKVGITGRAARGQVLRDEADSVAAGRSVPAERPWDRDDWYDVYAEVLPEDKMRLIANLQRASVVVGMTGDGVNDAPALKKAEVGIAVASATDVAKAAASLVLTDPGLEDMVAGVEVSRRIHQRMLTYTLNKIIKTMQVAVFLGFGLVVFGKFVTTPTLVVLLLLANDFVTMSLATDRVRSPRRPDRWRVAPLVLAGLGLALPLVLLSFALWWFGTTYLALSLAQMQTLVFLWLVLSGQATVYLVRERQHFWHSRPSRWLAGSSAADLVVVLLLAWRGWLMAAIPPIDLGVALGSALIFLVLGDLLKAWIFRAAGLRR
ncbi:MAG TPA: plasma-membrane proton-efflux P-type ATPase [Candidatus Nanopelagicaceae bacterium]|nr:plasma-membrane proton-efflux P-type ATPase [Candidatus Nanopelagicaceae bacterium]